jgi:hypothetical protein
MFENHRSTNRTLAIFVFISALILYLYTMAPTASFWDPGEFIAAAYGLEVNHPPGAPLFLLVGHLFSMFLPKHLVAPAVNFVSVLTSSLTIMLLYLIIVRLVREIKGYDVSQYKQIDRIAMYGGAIIGAFGFAVTDSFWFNSAEAEVYAFSMFFTSMVVWLALKWAENPDKPGNNRWLILIAYMVGLALGVHLLSLLALFFVGAIIYFKKGKLEWLAAIKALVLTIIAFLCLYPFTLNILPSILKGINDGTFGLIGPIVFIALVVIVMAVAIYITHKSNYYWANFILIGYAMVLIGYSSYLLVPIRSLANPPLNENNPSTIQDFINYVGRKQYGHTPLLKGRDYNNKTGRLSETKKWFPRRYSYMPQHLKQYAKYSSDWDYFWNYQVKHMYIRYFNWNFIGRNSDIQGAGWQAGFSKSHHANNPAHNSYYYLPFLLGLFGFLYHFQRDWKRAFSVLILFIMTGFAIIIFLNQTPLQPRERHYAYVGSFFAFSIWMGIGAAGLVDMAKEYLKSSKIAAYSILILCFAGIPFLMGFQNFNDHNRHNRYVASDYAYNLLQSVPYEGILFTNGDNDTFPLWYAQEVEGVRTDVRVVNLSLLNTGWYIKQLRDQWSHNSAPLPISLTNKQIKKLTTQLYPYQPDTISIPVNKKMLKKAFSGPHQYHEKIGLKRKHIGSKKDKEYKTPSGMKKTWFKMPIDSLDDSITWYYKGRYAGTDKKGNKHYYLRTQDRVALNIIKNNHWLRPIMFANTIPKDSKLGLQKYFRYQGQGSLVVPDRHPKVKNLGWVNTQIMANTFHKFRFRHWKGIYLNSYIRRMFGTYRLGIQKLTNAYLSKDEPDSADKWLKWGKKNIPFYPKIQKDGAAVRYAYSFARAGDLKNALDMVQKSQKRVFSNLNYHFGQYQNIRQHVLSMKNDIKKARQSANTEKQRKLMAQITNLVSQSQDIGSNIDNAYFNLVLMQHIYYMAGKDEKGDQMASRVKKITHGLLKFPSDKKENKKEIKKLGY